MTTTARTSINRNTSSSLHFLWSNIPCQPVYVFVVLGSTRGITDLDKGMPEGDHYWNGVDDIVATMGANFDKDQVKWAFAQ
jgi:hypothetical protein